MNRILLEDTINNALLKINSTVGTTNEKPIDYFSTTISGYEGGFYKPIFGMPLLNYIASTNVGSSTKIPYGTALDENYIYFSSDYIYKYDKNNFAINKKSDTTYNANFLIVDDNYLFAASEDAKVIYKFNKNTLELISQSSQMVGRPWSFIDYGDNLYYFSYEDGKIYKVSKANLTITASSSAQSSGGFAYKASCVDSNFLYFYDRGQSKILTLNKDTLTNTSFSSGTMGTQNMVRDFIQDENFIYFCSYKNLIKVRKNDLSLILDKEVLTSSIGSIFIDRNDSNKLYAVPSTGNGVQLDTNSLNTVLVLTTNYSGNLILDASNQIIYTVCYSGSSSLYTITLWKRAPKVTLEGYGKVGD